MSEEKLCSDSTGALSQHSTFLYMFTCLLRCVWTSWPQTGEEGTLLLNHIWGQSSGLFGAMSPPRGTVCDLKSSLLLMFTTNTEACPSTSPSFTHGRLETCSKRCAEHLISQRQGMLSLCWDICIKLQQLLLVATLHVHNWNCFCRKGPLLLPLVSVQLKVRAPSCKCPAALSHASEETTQKPKLSTAQSHI